MERWGPLPEPSSCWKESCLVARPGTPGCPPLIISCTRGPVPGAGTEALKSWETHQALVSAIIAAVFANNQCVGGSREVSAPRNVWGGASWSLGPRAWAVVGMGPGETSSLLHDGEHELSGSSSSWDSGNETYLKNKKQNLFKPTEKLKEEFREHLLCP